ncbi:MAG: VCBS repeat-containing protein [Candidatus Acidiferrales bacterium]
MRRGFVLLLAPIIIAVVSFLPSAVGKVVQKTDRQVLNLTPASSPIYARSPMSGKQLAFVTASTSPQNAAILSPVPPPSPTSPTTFKNGVVIPVTGTAGGSGFQDFVVEWAPGLDAASGWQTTGVTLAGAGATPVASGSLATWDTGSIVSAGYYTIRLTVNLSGSAFQALTMIYLEPDLFSANWPQTLNLGPASGAGVVPARNVDGTYRLLLETPAGPGSTGGELWSLSLDAPAQRTLHTSNGSFMHPAVADFTGTSGDQAMIIDFITGSPVSSDLELFQQDGSFKTLESSPNLWSVGSQVVVEDLAGDSRWETVTYGIDYTNSLASVSAWLPDGSLFSSNFPLTVTFANPNDGRLNRNPVLVGDINGDGKKEIVTMEVLSPSTFTLALFANDGSPLTWQVPSSLPGVPVVMAAADLDNNGKLETILAANTDAQTFLHVFQPDGTERTGWPLTLYNSNVNSQSYLAVADLNVDGNKEIVYSHESLLYVLKPDGSSLSSAWPLQASPASESFGYNAVAVGDVDGDGFPEIVTVLNTLSTNSNPVFALGSYADQQLLAIRRDGTISRSWQLNAGNGCWLQFFPAPTIGDFDENGVADIAVASYIGEGSCVGFPGIVTLLSTGAPFNPGLNDWPLVRHDPRQTSVLLCSDFCFAAGSAQTVTAGSTASYTLTITPNDLPYQTAIANFTCAGLPSGASCNFNPSSVTPGVQTTASTSLSISTTAGNLATARPIAGATRVYFAALFAAGALGLMPIFAAPLRQSRGGGKLIGVLFLFGLLVGVSCGGGSGGAQPNPNGTPAGTYTITVSATGASKTAKTTTLSLIVN